MNNKTVLLVDDDPFIRRIAEIILFRLGNWNVVAAINGNDAIDAIARERPDLVLLDVIMPGMDGTKVLHQIRERYGDELPVIFLTGKVQEHELETYKNSQADGVICKPFDPVKLPMEIETLLARKAAGRLSESA